MEKQQDRTPQIALLAAGRVPRNGLLVSMLLHSAIVPMVISVHLLAPALPPILADNITDSQTHVALQPIFLPIYTGTPQTGPASQTRGARAREVTPTISPVTRETFDSTFAMPKIDYAGAQQLVSAPPNAARGVQTIRRPDLVQPPKLANPILLPSQVTLPPPKIAVPIPTTLQHPLLGSRQTALKPNDPPVLNPEPPAPSQITLAAPKIAVPLPARLEHPVQPSAKGSSTVLPNDPLGHSTAVPPAVASLTPGSSQPEPPTGTPSSSLGQTSFAGSNPEATKAIVVMNAVTLPPLQAPPPPDAELATRFVVGPSPTPSNMEASAQSGGSPQLPFSTSAGNSLHTNVEGNDRAGAGIDRSKVNNGRVSPSRSTVGGETSGDRGHVSGISISGGIPDSAARVGPADSASRANHPITIISGGSSGGGTRDLGVFERSETVYTIYLPMTDVAGGPDWPIQYALLNAGRHLASRGLLTPPAVLKKVLPKIPKAQIAASADAGPVYVTGIIDENGYPQHWRPVRASDARATVVLDALAQWEFLPAELDGIAVETKVLIGVTLVPKEDAPKQHE